MKAVIRDIGGNPIKFDNFPYAHGVAHAYGVKGKKNYKVNIMYCK